MRIVKSLLPVLVIASLLSSLSYAAAPDRISGALTSGQTVPLRGNVHHLAQPHVRPRLRGPAVHAGRDASRATCRGHRPEDSHVG